MPSKDEYQKTAAVYDLLFSRALKSVRKNICTFLTYCQAADVIDLCCGTGEQLRMLSESDMHLTGVDFSQAMLNRARNTSPSSIHYLEADAAHVKLAQSSYDAVIISFALHEKNALQHTAIYHEACRLLRPGGHIIIADYVIPPSGFLPFLLGRILIQAIERAAGITHYHNYRDWMKNGALEGFLARRHPGRTTLIAPHCQGCIHLCAVSQVQESPLQSSLNTLSTHSTEQACSIFPLSKEGCHTIRKGKTS